MASAKLLKQPAAAVAFLHTLPKRFHDVRLYNMAMQVGQRAAARGDGRGTVVQPDTAGTPEAAYLPRGLSPSPFRPAPCSPRVCREARNFPRAVTIPTLARLIPVTFPVTLPPAGLRVWARLPAGC